MKNTLRHTCFILFFISSLFLNSLFSQTTTIYSEDFSYPSGIRLVDAGGGWNNVLGGNLARAITIVDPSLMYNGYIGSGIGKTSYILPITSDTGSMLFHNFSQLSSGSIYYSFMLFVEFNNINLGDSTLITGLSEAGTSSNYINALYIKSETTTGGPSFNIGLAKRGQAQFLSTSFSPGDTLLVVLKYQFLPAVQNSDIASIFIFRAVSIPKSEPLQPNITVTSGINATNIGRVFINSILKSKANVGRLRLKIDGIRIGTSWSILLPQPPPPLIDTSKVVFDIDYANEVGDPIRFLGTISETKKLARSYDSTKTVHDIIFIVHHKAVKYFDSTGMSMEPIVKTNYLNTFRKEIDTLQTLGVKVILCSDAIRNYMQKGSAYNFCTTVPLGTREIVRLQNLGYRYIKFQ